MGVFYGDKIEGIRLTRVSKDHNDKYDIVFEIKFTSLTQQHMTLIIDTFNKMNETEDINYYFYRTVTTSHEWCANSDEVLYYMWVKSTRENMKQFIEENSSI